MKYKSPVYKTYGSFIAEAVEIAKDRIILHEQVVDPQVRKRLKNKGFSSFLDSLIWLISYGGWPLLLTIASLVGLGVTLFFAEMTLATLANPLLALIMAITGGSFVYAMWTNRDVILATKKVGLQYVQTYHDILAESDSLDDRLGPVDKLMKECVKSICVEVFGATNAVFLATLNNET